MTKKTAPKKTATKPAESAPKTYDPGSIGEARPDFFTHLKDERNTAEPTLYTYGKDFAACNGLQLFLFADIAPFKVGGYDRA